MSPSYAVPHLPRIAHDDTARWDEVPVVLVVCGGPMGKGCDSLISLEMA